MKLEQAKQIADKYVNILKPYCQRIAIAGSIRRKKEEVKDIEIVCIPDSKNYYSFAHEVNKLRKVKGEPTGKYTQRRLLEGIILDLFMTRRDNWGLIFSIRTGSASFSHKVLATTWVKNGFKSVNGMLTKNGKEYPLYEEKELFDLLGLEYIEPEKRY